MTLSAIVIFSCYTAIASGFVPRMTNHGETAKEKEFPYQVSLRYNNEHFCGGSLISKNHVLTAAHCIEDVVNDDDLSLEKVSVEVGMIKRGYGQIYTVKRISYYPQFSFTLYQNDLAIVHLDQSIEISDKVSIINLPQANSSLLPGTRVFVSGFGAENRVRSLSPVLKQMDAEIVSIEECQKNHEQHRLIVGNICAKKGKDYGICEGDSGGPLVDEAKKTVIGVVSGGDDDCSGGTPDVYTEVSRYIPYINAELKYDPRNPRVADEKHAINLKN